LRAIAAALLAKAADGNVPAINTLADRTDGKVAQALIGDSEQDAVQLHHTITRKIVDPAEFSKNSIRYECSQRDRSQVYLAALPLLNARRVKLLESTRLINQLCALQRRTSSGGRQTVDHPRNGADDLANAAMGAVAPCVDASLAVMGHGGGLITRPGFGSLAVGELHPSLLKLDFA
jgi:hypothetical protein